MSGKPSNRVGKVYGRLTVIEYIGNSQWLCECSCEEKSHCIVKAGNLTSGNTISCGCFRNESKRSRGEIWTDKMRERAHNNASTHGKYGTRTYNTWAAIIQRCTNPNRDHYENYGGRGITVCDRWRESFANFFEDVGECPKGCELDRIDRDGNYEPGNCQWVTHKVNSNNHSNNRFITYNKETLTLTQWSEKTGLSPSVIHSRLAKHWSVERALTTPLLGTNSKLKTIRGKVRKIG
jgi:hypothetical protein